MADPDFSVSKTAAGFVVLRDGQQVAGPFESHALAWKRSDRMHDDDISPSERRADYGLRKFAHGE